MDTARENGMEILKKIFDGAGVFQYGVTATKKIVFSEEVRKMCEVNTCRQYGKTWACPPAIGTVEECRERVCKYDNLIVFTGKYELEDSFDFEGMQEGLLQFKQMCQRLDDKIKQYLDDYLMLANEGCALCETCTYPDAPCRFPERVKGALEGYGIWVSELAKQAHVNYINGANTVTYFGAISCNLSIREEKEDGSENLFDDFSKN